MVEEDDGGEVRGGVAVGGRRAGGGRRAVADAAALDDFDTGDLREVMRTTFKAFQEVIRTQGEAIATLEEALEGKADRVGGGGVQGSGPALVGGGVDALARGQLADLSARVVELGHAVASKADTGEVAAQLEMRPTKRETRAAVETRASAGSMADMTANLLDMGQVVQETRRTLEALAGEVKEVKGAAMPRAEALRLLERKADRDSVARSLEQKADVADVRAKISAEKVAQLLEGKADRAEVSGKADWVDVERELRGKVEPAALEDKVREFRDALRPFRETQQDLEAKLADLTGLFGRQMSSLEAGMRDKAGTSDVRHWLDQKADSVAFRKAVQELGDATSARLDAAHAAVAEVQGRWLEVRAKLDVFEGKVDLLDAMHKTTLASLSESVARKADAEDMRSFLAAKVDLGQLQDALVRKAGVTSVNDALGKLEALVRQGQDEVAERLDALRRETAGKAGGDEVRAMLGKKAAIEDVNRALLQVNKELEGMPSRQEFDAALHDQAVINQGLASDLSQGRWLWKSGKVSPATGGIPWNVQTLNTSPGNYLWERDRVNLTCVAPGLYEVTLGFFTKRRPSIQVLVNGEPVLSAVNNVRGPEGYGGATAAAPRVAGTAGGKVAKGQLGRHSAGNVTGLTLIDFLSLPAHAKVAVVYQGEEGGQGFLGLRKL